MPPYWFAIDAGYASLHRSFSKTGGGTSDGVFSLAFRGGFQVDPRFLVGLELSGWTVHATSPPPVPNQTEEESHETIANYFLTAQWYPVKDSALFARGGFGLVVYSNDSPGETGGNGWGGNVGIGYDYFLRKGYKRDWYLTPSIDYAVGSIQGATKPAGVTQDQHYWALTARLGLTFR